MALTLPANTEAQLLRYLAELEKWNHAYNLTAIRDSKQMVTRHLLDSLALLPVLDGLLADGATLLDVGAGAGLPCIPLAIARPQWQITGLDSVGKKARFMRHAGRTLGLANFAVHEGRVEALSAPPFTAITSRAFASLAEFFALTTPLLASNGYWVAMKGKLTPEEMQAIPANIAILSTPSLRVPGVEESRHAVIARFASPL